MNGGEATDQFREELATLAWLLLFLELDVLAMVAFARCIEAIS
jgi:hypothetical protein